MSSCRSRFDRFDRYDPVAVNDSIAISHASLTVRDVDGQSVGVVCPRRAVMRRHGLRQVEEGETNGCKRHQDRREHCPDPPGAERPENCSHWTGPHILSKSGIRRPGMAAANSTLAEPKGGETHPRESIIVA